jgi:hypothetical protein
MNGRARLPPSRRLTSANGRLVAFVNGSIFNSYQEMLKHREHKGHREDFNG